jgi:hypothetical protein
MYAVTSMPLDKANAGDLAQRRVRFLGRHGAHLGAHAALKGIALHAADAPVEHVVA